MREMEVRACVRGRSAAEVYAVLSDFEHYPEHCPSVRSVEVEAVGDDEVLSTWVTTFRGGVLRWVERDVFNPAEGTIYFEQTQGDIKSFNGWWKVEALEG